MKVEGKREKQIFDIMEEFDFKIEPLRRIGEIYGYQEFQNQALSTKNAMKKHEKNLFTIKVNKND